MAWTMRDVFTQIWLPLAVSGLSFAALLYASWEGLKLDPVEGGQRLDGERRARRAAWAGMALLLLAVLLWAAYLLLGPVHDLGFPPNGD
jgi:drug/metabolite transporter (DMT)-like permease